MLAGGWLERNGAEKDGRRLIFVDRLDETTIGVDRNAFFFVLFNFRNEEIFSKA